MHYFRVGVKKRRDFRCFALANKTCTTCKRIMCVHGWCVGLMNFHENKEIHHRAFVGIVRVEVNLYRARSFYHLTNPTATPTRPLFSSFLTKPVYSRERKGRKTLLASICFFIWLPSTGIYSLRSILQTNFPAVELSAHPFSSVQHRRIQYKWPKIETLLTGYM